MDTCTFITRNERTDDHSVRRDERYQHHNDRYPCNPHFIAEYYAMAEQLTEDMGRSRVYWLRKLGAL
jgi:hypothetical protein